MLDSAMDAVIMIDIRGRILYWNPAAADMFGRESADVVGEDMAALIIPPELQGAHRRAFSHSELGTSGRILGRRIEVEGQHADGTRFPVELTITRTDAADAHVFFTGYLRDITERRRLLEDLRESRARMLTVSDRTRRELERDLHDGAQQQLVGAAMIVSQARQSLTSDPAATGALLLKAGEVLVDAIAEVRELAQGVHPRTLTEHGLAPALAELRRRSPIPVELDAAADRWPGVVETTLYFAAAEALTNAAKHGARHARVRVHTAPANAALGAGVANVVAEIVDDGPGGADTSQGTGLRGLHDRVAAVGGSLDIDSPPGGGTTLTVRLNLPPSS
ncbi:MAG TPA: PAS domain S-box protein [Propionibacteriaceae bacterium]|nr:PAS domain S-box protein [Propionibacteriaceae bacterium]